MSARPHREVKLTTYRKDGRDFAARMQMAPLHCDTRGRLYLGRAVQVDPIKPTLKAPGTTRLKLQYDGPLSKFAFKFNLRQYNPGEVLAACNTIDSCFSLFDADQIGRCRLTLSNPR